VFDILQYYQTSKINFPLTFPHNCALIVDNMDNTLTNTELYSHKNIPLETLVGYRNKGLSYRQIAKLAGCSSINVFHRLKYAEDDIIETEGYADNRAWVFDNLAKKLIFSITEDEIKSLNPYQRVVALGILYDKYRLETNQSTSNVGLTGRITVIAQDSMAQKALADTIRGRRRAEVVGLDTPDNRDSGNGSPIKSQPRTDNSGISPGDLQGVYIIEDYSGV